MRPNENIPTEENYLKTLSLSEIELEILYHIKSGLTSREISSIRGCSARTIEKHRSRIISIRNGTYFVKHLKAISNFFK